VSHGLAPAPGTEFAVDSNKTPGSRTLDYSLVLGTALANSAEVIPVAGSSLKAAIGTLIVVLAFIDVSVTYLRRHPTHIGT